MGSMWRATVGAKPAIQQKDEDDWETDPDFVNDISEKEQRWGSKTISGSGHQASVNLSDLRNEALKADELQREKKLASMPKPSEGYGGKFGVQTDRMDKSAETFAYRGTVEAHASQKDATTGYGGKFGVQSDRKDSSALGWDDKVELSKHNSQKDAASGYGGKFGVQKDRQDKSASGWEDKGVVAPHESQTDYKKGFGGKFGLQTDRQDKSAAGWEEKGAVAPHESQTDYKKGFGGKFGLQSDRQDKSAVGWEEKGSVAPHESQIDYKKGFGGKFGVQSDRQDKSAAGWDEKTSISPHESQTDYKKGFGGKFGVQDDRQDKTAVGWEHHENLSKHESQLHNKGIRSSDDQSRGGIDRDMSKTTKEKPVVTEKGNASSLRARFEQMATQDSTDRVAAERERRRHEDEALREQQRHEEEQRQTRVEQEWAQREAAGFENENPAVELETQTQVTNTRRLGPAPGAISVMPDAVRSPPFAAASPAIIALSEPEEHQERTPAPVAVLPSAMSPPSTAVISTGVSALHSTVRRMPSSDDEETGNNDDEWNDDVPALKVTPVAATAYSAEPRDVDAHLPQSLPQYDVVPGSEGNGISSPAMRSTEPGSIYEEPPIDVPPPAPSAPAQYGSMYEEPPSEEIHQHGGAGDCGLVAVALYDYQKQDDDEISFEPDDIITNIEQVDAGWWRGTCRGAHGLFPANYVELRK